MASTGGWPILSGAWHMRLSLRIWSRRTVALIHDPGPPDEGELRSSFKAFTWFLDRAAEELWNLLADKLVPASDGFETDATLLTLVYAATSANAPILLDDVAASLAELGWRAGDRGPVQPHDLYWLRADAILTNVSSVQSSSRASIRPVSPAAARLARAALRRL
jgi:hypothetical protein